MEAISTCQLIAATVVIVGATIGYERVVIEGNESHRWDSAAENILKIKGKEYELKIHIRYSVFDCHCICLLKMFLNYFE
ncbi:hypothetical protein CEXT_338661 [Caerostris extrusa]|uniref:Uncharacterized protein n=1 Tax=Caerostris extrusa TaxID=172846 RepID=A0AAV4XGL4_CAEEX|nr:hypothetical protein CEXT_338661 [Caerostris extrusa]